MLNPDEPLSDAAVRRVLARAAELELQEGAGLRAGDLRRAALEAGIRAAAIDAAMAEHTARTTHRSRGRWLRDALLRNAGAALAFVGVLKLSAAAAGTLGGAVELRQLANLLSVVLGVAVAHRLQARVVRDGLVAVGAGQCVVFVFALAGVIVVQPHVLNWGTLLTGVLATISLRLLRRGAEPPAAPLNLGQLARALTRWRPWHRSESDAEPRSLAGRQREALVRPV